MIDKYVRDCSDKKLYLLGVESDGTRYYLEEGSFDCSWYWGFGYVESKNSHSHFDGMFLKGNQDAFKMFKSFFVEVTLTDDEIWKLMELMSSFYTASNYSDMIYRGGSHFTNNPCKEIIKDSAEYDRINKQVIPAILEEAYKLLSE